MGNGTADNIAELVQHNGSVMVILNQERICKNIGEEFHQYLIDNSKVFSSKKKIIFDMQEVSHIDSYAIREFVELQKRYSGKDLGLCNLSKEVECLLRFFHIDHIIPCYPDLGPFEELYHKADLDKMAA